MRPIKCPQLCLILFSIMDGLIDIVVGKANE